MGMGTWPGLLLPVVVLLQVLGTCGYNPETCGKRPLAPKHGKDMRVVGGVDAFPGKWPWLVSIQTPSSTGPQHSCGGTLLAPRWVLTAAHCFKTKKSSLHLWKIIVGATDLSDLPGSVQIHSVSKVVLHHDYNPLTEENDIALIQLDGPVTFNNYAQPACLPRVTMDSETKFIHCFVSGWGITAQNSMKTSDVLQEAKVNILETKKCNSSQWYKGAMSPHTLCAGYKEGGIDTCQGDSGGPLMCKTSPNSLFYVIGITSWGKGCGEANSPGIYTSTQDFLEWILGEMIEIDEGTEEEAPPTNVVTILPNKTLTSQHPEDLEVNTILLPTDITSVASEDFTEDETLFTPNSPVLTAEQNIDDGKTSSKAPLGETESTIALQDPFVPPIFFPPSLEPPYLPREKSITLEPPVYPRESYPTGLAPPYVPKEELPTPPEAPYIPQAATVNLEAPFIAEQETYTPPEPPILPTQPTYVIPKPAKMTSYRALFMKHSERPPILEPPYIPLEEPPYIPLEEPPYIPPEEPRPTEFLYTPPEAPYTPPLPPYIPSIDDIPLEEPYIPPEKPHHIEHPYTPSEALYTPIQPPYVPEETPAILEPPYTPPEKPHRIERPYTPSEALYSPIQPPYVPKEAPAILDPPYTPPEKPHHIERPYTPSEVPYTPRQPPYVPKERSAILDPPYTPPEKPHHIERPYTPSEVPYTPKQPPYVPKERSAILDPPYTPPEKPHHIERPYTPSEVPYTPKQPPYVPKERSAILDPPYTPPEKPHHIERPYIPPISLVTPPEFLYVPPETAASLNHLESPSETVQFQESPSILKPTEVPEMPLEHLPDFPDDQHMQEFPQSLELPYVFQ